MQISRGKVFQKPAPGLYLGTVTDVVDMPGYQSAYGVKDKVRIVWALGNLNGKVALDNEGQQFSIVAIVNAVLTVNSRLSEIVSQVAPDAAEDITNTDQLKDSLVGRSNQLVLKAGEKDKNGDFYVNVAAILPLEPGQVPPEVQSNEQDDTF